MAHANATSACCDCYRAAVVEEQRVSDRDSDAVLTISITASQRPLYGAVGRLFSVHCSLFKHFTFWGCG